MGSSGHDEEVKDSIQHLEAYRSTLTDATLPIPKAAADRMILLAEVFTSMIASAPVDVVVESIQAMKASGEKPSIVELEEASRRMLDMLDGSKSDTQGVSDDMPADDQADVSTEPDMPGEVDMPSGIDTRTHDQAMASAEVDMSVSIQDDTSTITEAPVIDTDAGVRSDMPKLDDMLKGLMKFETKLFGEEDEAKLRAFISQLKADEAGHDEEVKDSIQHLE